MSFICALSDVDVSAAKILTRQKPILICCAYNPPSRSPFLCDKQTFDSIIKELNIESNCEPYECTLITGDLNLSKTDWNTMSSSDDYESEIVDLLSESNFTSDRRNWVHIHNRQKLKKITLKTRSKMGKKKSKNKCGSKRSKKKGSKK